MIRRRVINAYIKYLIMKKIAKTLNNNNSEFSSFDFDDLIMKTLLKIIEKRYLKSRRFIVKSLTNLKICLK